MPTVILLDVSLSMCKPVLNEIGGNTEEENKECILLKTLASLGCSKILDHFAQHCKLEFTSLIIFSSLYEVVVPFTRDCESIKLALSNIDDYDMTSLQVGLLGASQHILEEWGNGTPCQILLVTDGTTGLSEAQLLQDILSPHPHNLQHLPLPFPFPAKLNVVCIAHPDDPEIQRSLPIYQKFVEINGDGNVYIPEGKLCHKSVMSMFDNIIKDNFDAYNGTLHCGNLSDSICLSPPPQPYCRNHDFEVVREVVSDNIVIHGFLSIADVSSPPAFSRHLLLPQSLEENVNKENEEIVDDGKVPSFCVLLHGGLKRESMIALCQLNTNWYGMIYSWADSKKKSNLMLSIFEPGINVIPWLGNLSDLGSIESLPRNPYNLTERVTPFPIKASEKKSYAQYCVVWVRQGGLQSDIQKILRHARKLPEKQQSFYKELNRIRRAALMYGFPDLLTGLANLLERECYGLPTNAHPEASIQLQHASEALRSAEKDAKQNIAPYKNSFQ